MGNPTYIQDNSMRKWKFMAKVTFRLISGTIEEPYGTFIGEFRFNKKEGDGEYKYLNGNVYRGHYVCGKKKGYGELFSTFEEIIYRGEWANDVPERNPEVLL